MSNNILGDVKKRISTPSQLNNFYNYPGFISQVEREMIINVFNDEGWLIGMQEMINQFKRNTTTKIIFNLGHEGDLTSVTYAM